MTRIKDMRIKFKKTQQEIAELLCINRTTYTKWENETHVPDIASLQRLAQIFKTTVAYLLGETDNPEQKKEPATDTGDGLSEVQRINIELLKGLTPDEAVQVRAYIQGLKDARKA
jgi:transcriptional regulator with XRE-family HTH domain